MTQEITQRLLDCIEHEIVPLTRDGVAKGNKIFGAALLHKDTLETVIAETNNEIENPLWHGEMHCLKRFYEMPAETRPATEDLIFLSTHEPCSLCLSAITWAGFDNFTYFFSYENSRDDFAIPHDLKILKEVFGRTDYETPNAFWESHSLMAMIAKAETPDPLVAQSERILAAYRALSELYQAGKNENDIPLR